MSAATTPAPRRDPINKRYFGPVELADKASDILFYATAALSLGIFGIDKATHPVVFDAGQICFVVLVALLCAVGLASRLYWTPKALDARRRDFLSHAFGVALTHEQTSGYYNNNETDPVRKLGVATMENCHFTRAIAARMATWERIRGGCYLIVFLVVAMLRHADLAIVATVTQVVFSEQILSRWGRLEWLRMRSDRAYEGLYALFLAPPSSQTALHAKALEWFAYYEAAKDGSGITLSGKIFAKLNPSLTAEWEDIKRTLKL